MPDPTPPPGSDAEWHALLQRLRQQPAAPQPYFYGRVRARLVASSAAASPLRLPDWLRRPAYATLLGLLILAVSGDGARTTDYPNPPTGRYAAP